AKSGADVVVLDGMQGGTAATQDVFIEHVGIPTLAAIRPAVQALQDLGLHRKVQLVVSGGIRSGADVAKVLALGADAVAIGTAALIALGDNDPRWQAEYEALGTTAGAYDDWHEGRDPAGITTQDPELAKRLDPKLAGRRLANYLKVMTLEAQTIARACGKNHVHNLEPEDLVALTVEAAAMAQVPLAGLLLFAGALALAAGSPGPSIAALVARVISRGNQGVIPFIAAMWIGEAIWLALAVFGLSVIAQTFYWAFLTIKYLGLCYLAYLAYKMWTAPVTVKEDEL